MPTQIEDRLNANQTRDLHLVSSMISKGESTTSVDRIWKKFLKDSANDFIASGNEEPKLEINEIVQYVLSESYEESISAMQYYSEKVRYYNEMKKKIRDHISDIRNTMQDYLNAQEKKLEIIGDDAQLANIEMQNWVQKQQQFLQALSNISKVLHDTALAIIRKIGK